MAEMVATVPSPGPDEIRLALERVLASADFDASERNRRFLRHVIEETLAGRAERIKAYNIATTVFGRDDRFDPQLDSIVRIEAGRLRRSLERYYLTSGRRRRPASIRTMESSCGSNRSSRPKTVVAML